MFGNDGNDKVIAKDAVINYFYAGAGLNNIVYPKAHTEYAITYKSAGVLNVLPSKATTAYESHACIRSLLLKPLQKGGITHSETTHTARSFYIF